MHQATEKRKWKRRVIVAASLLVVLAGIFAYLVLARFHFSTQTLWPLAQLQWNHGADVEFGGKRPEIIGHRGSAMNSSQGDLMIGNTFTAIDQGISAGVDWIEIDIRASSDEHLVVFHDEKIDKKTAGQGKVTDLSVAELGSIRVHVEPPESIPTLEDVFNRFSSNDVRWILDVKAKGIHRQVLRWVGDKIERGELSSNQVIIFGTYDILLDYRDSGYSLGYIAGCGNLGNHLRVLFRQSEIVNRCRFLDCDYLVLPVIFANKSLIATAQSNGLSVWVYGVDDKRDFNYLASCGITGFIVDHPRKFTLHRE